MRILLLTALVAAPNVLAAQQRDITPIVDRVFSSWTAPGSPGCAVGVARGGEVLLTKGYGLADLETGRAQQRSASHRPVGLLCRRKLAAFYAPPAMLRVGRNSPLP